MITEPVAIGKKEYVEDFDIQTLAEKVIKKENIDVQDAKIRYLMVSPNVTKTIAARIIKTGAETKLFADCDYIVEVSREIWNSVTDEVKYILLHHELLHIHIEEKKDEVKYLLCDHDVQDFSRIIKKHGVDWLEAVRTVQEQLKDKEKSDKDSSKGKKKGKKKGNKSIKKRK